MIIIRLISKSILCILFLNAIQIELKAQKQIVPMKCEGAVPEDLQRTASEFLTGQNDFENNSLLGVFELLNSGNVLFGNDEHLLLQKVGEHILQKNNITANLHFYILRSGLFNAFATDDGYIFATTALMAQVQSEDELAFVLCHEISHYLLKHNLQRFILQEKTTKDAFEEIRKARKNKKNKIDKKDLEISLDRLLRNYYAYNRNQESQADSLGLVLFLKTNFSTDVLAQLFESMGASFPLFEKYEFKHEYFFTQNIKAAQFISDPLNYNQNFGNENDNVTIRQSDIVDSIYDTHPDHLIRYKQLKNRIEEAQQNNPKRNPTPISEELKFNLWSEQYLHLMQLGHYEHAAVYLNIIEQEFPNVEDLSGWKVITGIPLLNRIAKIKVFYPKSNEIDAHAQFSRALSALPALTIRNSLADYLNKEVKNRSLLSVCNQYTHVLYILTNEINRKKPLKTLDSIKWKNSTNNYITFHNESKELIKNIPLGEYIAFSQPTTLINSKLIHEKRTDLENSNSSLILMHGNIIYGQKRPTSSVEIAKKTEYGISYILKEIEHYGNSEGNSFTRIDLSERTKLTTENYNMIHQVNALVGEIFTLEDSILRPVGAVLMPQFRRDDMPSKVNIIYQNCFDGGPSNVGIKILSSYFSIFSFMAGRDFGAYFENYGTKYQLINLVLDVENCNTKYIALYDYRYRYREDAWSALAQKINRDLGRNLK